MATKEESFVEEITRQQGILLKVACMYCREPEERRDLFQEMVYQLWRAWDSFSGKSKLSSWMYQVAINTAITWLRRQKRNMPTTQLSRHELQLPAHMETPRLETDEQRQFLYRAIEQLSQVEKAIVMLYLEDHSYEEIAAIMGISKNLVGVKLNRIKKKLRKMIVPHFN
ncbi:MAG: sigma-70 family RNA polymerase sigma factor [Bacteroidetes bacterium]|nr:MAG: sigma-70 family RNA polymerase sigma factor [Bacteroidota bacterium]